MRRDWISGKKPFFFLRPHSLKSNDAMDVQVQSTDRAELVGHSSRPWFVSFLNALTNGYAYSVLLLLTGQIVIAFID
jgi:hypothetical protein